MWLVSRKELTPTCPVRGSVATSSWTIRTFQLDAEHVIWKEGARRQKGGVLLFIDDEIVDQSNMNSAIESVILAYGDRIKALVGRGVRARLVMGFFFDTSKVAAFGFDLSEKTLSSLAQLGLGVTLDVFPCSELED